MSSGHDPARGGARLDTEHAATDLRALSDLPPGVYLSGNSLGARGRGRPVVLTDAGAFPTDLVLDRGEQVHAASGPRPTVT